MSGLYKMRKTVDIIATIFALEADKIIEEKQLEYFLQSVFNNDNKVKIDLAYRNFNIDYIDCFNFYKIKDDEYAGKRDYFKIANTKRVVSNINTGLLAVLDVDMVINKALVVEDDFDIAFTQRYLWTSSSQAINLGASFFNIKKGNKEKILSFIDEWLDAPIQRNHAVYNEFKTLPEIAAHDSFELDRIVHQDYICALAWKYEWLNPVIYDYNGLKIKILDYKYNFPWQFEQLVYDEISIYHLKGARNSKLKRTEKLFDILGYEEI